MEGVISGTWRFGNGFLYKGYEMSGKAEGLRSVERDDTLQDVIQYHRMEKCLSELSVTEDLRVWMIL